MPFDSSPDLLVDDSLPARRTSALLAIVAGAALIGNCLLNSPSRFSEQQLHDASPLHWVVWLLALGGQFPTARGVEIRNLIFYSAAAILAILAGARLALSGVRPRMSEDDLWDFRRRASSPYFWWFLLLIVSALSSWYAHAPAVCKGQTIARLLQAAWWFPLAALLVSKHVRMVAITLVAALATTAAIGIWYQLARVMPNLPAARLQYPMGNELWLAACLLPGVFVALGLVAARPRTVWLGAAVLALLVMAAALALTRSRSAAAGLVAGFVAAGLCLAPPKWRKPAILTICLLGIAGALYFQKQFSGGLRSHSFRSRIGYEWPYALHLFSLKPIAGHGDGAYSLLAGQFARMDQLDDPGIMRSDENVWSGHAHNEFLQLLCDLGILGTLAFAAAIGTTLYHAFRTVTASSLPGESPGNRWLVIGLIGALAASTVEACGTPAIREPGATPIVLTVWACLWALVRRSRPAVPTDERDKPFSEAALRLTGLVAVLGAAALGWHGIQDWRAARARFESEAALNEMQFVRSAQQADFAAAHLLDPFQKNLARMIATWARSLEFDRRLAHSAAAPGDDELDVAHEALTRLNQLKQDTPRFLRVSRIESALCLNLARAYERRGERASRDEYQEKFIAALEASRADEPFLADRVAALWRAKPTATVMDRLNWLRALIRVGEMDPQVLQLFSSLDRAPGFAQALEDLYQIAARDENRTPDDWEDRLSPETLRLAALAKALSGSPADAARLADRAVSLYEKAGPRLFGGTAAALHESVHYRFAADPTTLTEENLDRLARAHTLLGSPATRESTLAGSLGETRLHLLLAAGREKDAEAQIPRLESTSPDAPLPTQLAQAYVRLASSFAEEPGRYPNVQRWCRRAEELAPTIPDPHAVLIRAALRAGDESTAQSAARKILDLEPDRLKAAEYLTGLRQRYPGLALWADLAKSYPGLFSPVTSKPTTSQP
ncbi:MAG TPA: O-antigen ligase family protein [Phycisphaerae bacterium]|nr:O-antigen ligase family protein [Phycisphaerae bacterium]